MSFWNDLKLLTHPYYLVNLLLSLSFFLAKQNFGLCSYLFRSQTIGLNFRETDIIHFSIIFTKLYMSPETGKNRIINGSKSLFYGVNFVNALLWYIPHNLVNGLKSLLYYAHIANALLWGFHDEWYGITFCVVSILSALILPEPSIPWRGYVQHFRTENALDVELERDKRVNWLVTFDTASNPAYAQFALIFAELSNDYQLKNLRFGKMDVGRFPLAGLEKYNVSAFNRQQMPTVALFRNGKEISRRPHVDDRGIQTFSFSKDNLRAAFDLSALHKECQKKSARKNK